MDRDLNSDGDELTNARLYPALMSNPRKWLIGRWQLCFCIAVALVAGALLAWRDAARTAGEGFGEDWAYVDRFRVANREIGHARIVFIGDSITAAWPTLSLLIADQSVANRGIAGQTTQQMLVRFRSDVVALRPEIVHIMGGTNDVAENTGAQTPDEIAGNIIGMAEIARANGIAVILASVPPATRFPWNRSVVPAPRIRAVNSRLRAYAERKNLIFVDYWSVLAARDGTIRATLSDDGVHPNAAGYAAMRPVAETGLANVLEGPDRSRD